MPISLYQDWGRKDEPKPIITGHPYRDRKKQRRRKSGK